MAAEIIIIDDPLKPADAMSETRRGAVNDFNAGYAMAEGARQRFASDLHSDNG